MLETAVDGDIIALDVEHGACFGFNATASRVWEIIVRPTPLDALVAQLSGEYDVAVDACRGQIEALLAELGSRGLVSVTPAEPTA